MIPHKVYFIIKDLLPMIILFSVVMLSIRLFFALFAKEKIDVLSECKNLIYLIYCFILFKLVTTTDFESYANNFIPFREITRYKLSSILFYRNVIGNILLFIPFGYLISDMMVEKLHKSHFSLVFVISLITSCTIELIQMNIGRSFDIDDIILNIIGSILGYAGYWLIDYLIKWVIKKGAN